MRLSELLELGGSARTPMIHQAEPAECGIACLAMVLAHHGVRMDLTTLRARLALSRRGTTLRELCTAASDLGLVPEAVQADLVQLACLTRPAILHWRFDHFVVLDGLDRDGALILDPARGRRRVSHAELSDAYTGIALMLSPSARLEHGDHREPVSLSTLLGGIKGLYGSLTKVALVSLLLQSLALLTPLFLQIAVDQVVISSDRDLLLALGLGFAGLAIIRTGIEWIRALLMMRIEIGMSLRMGSTVVDHLLRLPTSYFRGRHTGDLLSRIGSLGPIRDALTANALSALIDGVLSIAIILVLYLYSPTLAAIAAIAASALAIARALHHRPAREAGSEVLIRSADVETHLLETIRGMTTVRAMGGTETRLSGWASRTRDHLNAVISELRLGIHLRAALGALGLLEHVLFVWVGATGVLDGDHTIGMLYAALAYRAQFSSRITNVIAALFQLRMTALHRERLGDIMCTEPVPAPVAHRIQASGPVGVRCQGLCFRYASRAPWLLHDLHLDVEPGESVAIIGPSGSGKSSLVGLLLGLLAPEAGRITIGGVDPMHLREVDRRGLVAALLQDDALFRGSIADNIALFDPSPDPGLIREACELACLDAEIDAMPMGLDSAVGDLGAQISAGQIQRILLARALYTRPRMLILDEATSNLDVALEKRISTLIRSLAITRIQIAHRPESVRAMDRVLRLAQGRLIDCGAPRGQATRIAS